MNIIMSGLCVHTYLRSNNNLFTRYESDVYNTRLSNRNTDANCNTEHRIKTLTAVGEMGGLFGLELDSSNFEGC